MRRRWRRFTANPMQSHRASQVMVALCAVVALLAAWLRERGGGSGTYLLDTLALLIAILSALLDTRYASFVGDFRPEVVRRGSLIRLIAGCVGLLAGCIMASIEVNGSSGDLIGVAGYGLLFAGLALGLGGLMRLLAVQGADYAATKVQERLDDEY
jgi:hypothetical protein